MYSVIIPTLNEGGNLWFTIHAIRMIWEHFSDEGHELIVVDNGSSDNTEKFMEDSVVQKFVTFIRCPDSGPGAARHTGAMAARGEILFFIDAHVLLSPNFFGKTECMMRNVIWDDVGIVHFPIAWNGGLGENFATCYKLTLEKNFWGEYQSKKFKELTEIAASGHACIAVRKDHFVEIGGISAPFSAYGGSEIYLNLKFALFGYKNYLFPDVYYLHCSQRKQNYFWSNDLLFQNQVIAAYTIGGEIWSSKVLHYHLNLSGWKPEVTQKLYAEAIEKALEDYKFIQMHAKRTLEHVLDDFKREGVPY